MTDAVSELKVKRLLAAVRVKVEHRSRRPFYDIRMSCNLLKPIYNGEALQKHLDRYHVMLSAEDAQLLVDAFPGQAGMMNYKLFAETLYPVEAPLPKMESKSQGLPFASSQPLPAAAAPDFTSRPGNGFSAAPQTRGIIPVLYTEPVELIPGPPTRDLGADVFASSQPLPQSAPRPQFWHPRKVLAARAGPTTARGASAGAGAARTRGLPAGFGAPQPRSRALSAAPGPRIVLAHNRQNHHRFHDSVVDHTPKPRELAFPHHEFKQQGRFAATHEAPRHAIRIQKEPVEPSRRFNISRQYDRSKPGNQPVSF